MKPDIILLASTLMESSSLRDRIISGHEKEIAGKNHVYGRLEERSVSLVVTGIGTVNTAHALTCVLERHRPKLVLQFGLGGAYTSSGLSVGDVAVATDEAYGDLGVQTPYGWASAELIGIPLLEKDGDRFYNTYPLDGRLASTTLDLIQNIEWDEGSPISKKGTFVTVQQCSGVTDLGDETAARFNGICENMEGVAAAQLCTVYDVPLVEIRAISNRVEDRNTADWDLELSVARIQQSVLSIVKNIKIA
ncbi:MAG: futalosine hydrolase [Gemmatimonadota bacterium]|nr:futalosine hydrolase [Gemmatimonadota bacterium]